MDDKTEEYMGKRINIIVDEFRYLNRKNTHPHECPCNSQGPCHNMEDLNCFFCYCPWYNSEKPEGGCKIGNPSGKGSWFERLGHETSDRIWDCSLCTYPHDSNIVKQVLKKLCEGKLNP
jgi:Zn-finger protein